MDEQERQHKIQRGKNAQTILENPAFAEAYDQVLNGLFAQFLSTEIQDDKKRQEMWSTGQSLKLIKAQLEAFAQTGRAEEHNRKYDQENTDG